MMALDQKHHIIDTTDDHHLSKRPKLNENDLLEDDAQDTTAVEAAVDFALQMLDRDQRRVRTL